MRSTLIRSLTYAILGLSLLVGSPALAADGTLATPTAGTEQRTLGDNAFALLPVSDTKELEIIATGALVNSNIPVIVKNNSSKTVYDVLVKVEARDAAGSLIGSGETPSSHMLKPSFLKPGDIALGFIYLEGDIQPDAAFKYSVKSSTEAPSYTIYKANVEFGEVNWLGDRIVGELINPASVSVSSVYLMLTCIGDDGVPLLSDVATVNEAISAGESTTFQMNGVFGDLSLCENFLIAGSGY